MNVMSAMYSTNTLC